MGNVYLLNAWGTDRYKIGFTKSDVKKRIKQLQTGCPDELILVKVYESEEYKSVESWMHRKHHAKRVEGEWFELTPTDIYEFHKDCEKFNETIKMLKENNPF